MTSVLVYLLTYQLSTVRTQTLTGLRFTIDFLVAFMINLFRAWDSASFLWYINLGMKYTTSYHERMLHNWNNSS